MHKNLPKIFVFLDEYDKNIFENNNINIGIIYRNYKAKKREKELIKIARACKISRNPLFVSNDIKLAIKVKANGIYIPAFNKKKYYGNLEKKNITIIGSAHNQKEIKKKISQKCTAIFLSPVFYVKKSKNYIGLHQFNYLSFVSNINFYALGGISERNLKKLKLLNIKGFGGISVFKKKTGLLKAGFYKD